MIRRRRLGILLFAFAFASGSFGVGLFSPSSVLAAACTSYDPKFAGIEDAHTNAVQGARVNIEFVNEALCTTAGGSDFSAFWSSVVGYDPNDPGFNIYQVGVDKCRGSACPAGVPVDQAYYFYAYGRMPGACGAAIAPVAKLAPLGNAGAGTKTYKVVKEYQSGAGWFYRLYINTSLQYSRYYTDLETCWNGVDAVQLANEVHGPSPQSGGSVANPQTWSSAAWYNGSAWPAITGVGGTNCDFVQLATMRCKWQQFDPSKWDSWDTRY